MEEAVIKYYRKLINTGFEHSGSLENPSIFLDNTMGNRILICGNMSDFMQIYINVVNDRIDDIKYKCSCNPTANVTVEVLCTLVKGRHWMKPPTYRNKRFSNLSAARAKTCKKR